ncbi:UNVERIFIED_CONTAM: hypothetical protein NCL1_26096 [Trichonephila clavipes]
MHLIRSKRLFVLKLNGAMKEAFYATFKLCYNLIWPIFKNTPEYLINKNYKRFRIVYQQAVEPGTTVNDSYYTNVLRTMVQQVKRKRPFFEMASYCTMTMPDHILLVA